MVQSKLLLKFDNVKHYFLNKSESLDFERINLGNKPCFSPDQVHGNKVGYVTRREQKVFNGYDGLVTKKSYYLRIKTADCMPIFFFDPKKRIIAAIHAGWKGLYSGIIPNALKIMNKLGCQNYNILAAIGPHIKECCYSVNYERIQNFLKIFLNINEIGYTRRGKWYLNLSRIALIQMGNYGLDKRNIDISDVCTYCNNDYSSYRREGKNCGRMLNIIALSL